MLNCSSFPCLTAGSLNYINLRKVKSFLIFFISFLYVVKQTILASNLVNIALAILLFSLLTLNIKIFILFVKKSSILAKFGLWSFLLTWVFFASVDRGLNEACKLIIFINLFLIDKDDNFSAMKSMALGFFSAILLIYILNLTGFIVGTLHENGVWIKNSFGFFNPNIGPFFLATIAYGCIFFRIGLVVPIGLVATFLATYDRFYSRSQMLVISTIALLLFLSFCKLNFRSLGRSVMVIFTLYSIFFYSIYFGYLSDLYSGLDYLNVLSSNRIKAAFQLPFLVGFTGPIFHAESSDGLLYDFLILLGPPFFIYFLYKGFQISEDSRNKNAIISLLVFIIFGLFEGLVNKLTTIGVGMIHILFTNKNNHIISNDDIIHSNYKKYHFYAVRTILVAGLIILLCSWNTTVLQLKIYSNPQLSYGDIIGPISSNNNCDKAWVTFSPEIDEKSAFISVQANNISLIEKCQNSITSLLSKDFDDIKHTKPIPIIYSDINEIQKDNFLRYILAFLLLIYGLIFLKT